VIDTRFYDRIATPSVAAIVAAVGGVLLAGDTEAVVTSVASADEAGAGDLAFLEDTSGLAEALVAGAVVLVPEGSQVPRSARAVIGVGRPRVAFARAASMIAVPREIHAGADGAAIHSTARIHPGAVLEPGCVVGPDAAVGQGSRIGAGAVIGAGVQIGQGGRIGARSVIRCTLIGDGVVILPGSVIGETGFGLGVGPGGAALVPHFGRVIIQNAVSIGANSTVDRGFLADTVIGEGTQIDNMCHVGHNVRIGRHVVMAAFAGISGSVEIGDGVMLGGRVGISDHIRVGAGARLAAGSAVMRDVPAGETHGGYPAKAVRTWMRELAWLSQAAQKRPGGKS
jgi:UDP-3-O-[3-hydroxymyristoyl] glucosamine N-acyltransferase